LGNNRIIIFGYQISIQYPHMDNNMAGITADQLHMQDLVCVACTLTLKFFFSNTLASTTFRVRMIALNTMLAYTFNTICTLLNSTSYNVTLYNVQQQAL